MHRRMSTDQAGQWAADHDNCGHPTANETETNQQRTRTVGVTQPESSVENETMGWHRQGGFVEKNIRNE